MPNKAWGVDYDVMFFGPEAPRALFGEEGGYAVVDVCGPLSQKPGWWTESYDEIRERFAAACQSKQPAVCLKLDSPGGDTAGNLELARDLRAMAATAGKRLVAFTDGMACSAAYALACAAEEIVTTPSASIGSIGVWCPLLDVTAQNAMWGVKYFVASSGKSKNDRNPNTGITDEAFARLQAQVDLLAANFFGLVAEFRPSLSVDAIKALEGADLFGPEGLAAGLSDRIVNSWQAFLANEEVSPMAVKSSKYDEAIGALKRAAEGDDEDAKKAKKALKALETEPEKTDDEKKKDEEAAAAKAADDEKAAKAADDEKKKDDEDAKSLALSLAGEVAALKAKDAARDAADAKAKADAELQTLFSKRPDLSDSQRAILGKIPLAEAKALVESWPRVAASPGSASAAQLARGTGGEKRQAYEPRLSAEETALLARLDAPTQEPTRAFTRGTTTYTPFVTPEQAKARLAELDKEGAV
jgi:ClpP class serine protease